MLQLPLFEDATQAHPPARSIACPVQQRSPRLKTARQQPLLALSAATTSSIAAPIAPEIDRPLPPVPTPAKELPPGWVDPDDPVFNYLKNCRLCGAPIEIGGLDHSLCSGDCGWVIDLQWLAWIEAHRRKRKEPEPQAATCTDSSERAALDLFGYGLDRDSATHSRAAASDRDPVEVDGGVA